MNFLEAYKESLKTGMGIKRKTQVAYGLIINKLLRNGTTIIAKYVTKDNVYPLDLEDIAADDWQVQEFE